MGDSSGNQGTLDEKKSGGVPIELKIDVSSKLLEKVWKSLDRATAGLFSAWRLRREGYATADVKAYEMRALVQAEKDAEEIRGGRARVGKSGALEALPQSQDSKLNASPTDLIRFLVENGERQIVADHLRKQINLVKTGLLAEAYASDRSGDAPNEDVSEEWLSRWRHEAQNVDDDSLRQIWAKLLTEETVSPGTHPIRLINLLGGLSRKDAELVEKLGQYVFDRRFIVEYVQQVKWNHFDVFKERIGLEELLYLQELGIVTGLGGLFTRSIHSSLPDQFTAALKIADRCVIIRDPDPKKKLEVGTFGLTQVGAKLVELGSFIPSEEYLFDMARAAKLAGFDGKVAKWKPSTELPGQIYIFDEVSPP